ncbi:MAG: hypothetical protein Tp1111DCM603221_6 [Prokaryotic dsDNA virus sp.]|nr:MAG: hypothetical protein Tp1111DCM603221_6 [Prokaryotic dsDNA virus sp.]|tara:strand:+ start:29448 stop:30296 length:849 start_codon:yes stop_codon:yes gene_type:complete
MAEKPSEEEIDDDTLLKLLMQRMTTLPAQTQTQSRSAPRVQTSTPANGNVTRSDLTPEFNEELRKAYKEGPQSRGERYFDQRRGSPDFERLRQFTEDAPRRVKKIDFDAPEHESRRLHREMRARTKGAQHAEYQDLMRHMETEYRGFRAGGGQMSTFERAGRAAGRAAETGVRRLGPVGALYGAYKAGEALGNLSPAARRAREREARTEEYEARQAFVKDVYPNRSEDFYRSMAKGMMNEDSSPPEGRTMEEILEIMQLQRQIDEIKDGTARELVRETRRGR